MRNLRASVFAGVLLASTGFAGVTAVAASDLGYRGSHTNVHKRLPSYPSEHQLGLRGSASPAKKWYVRSDFYYGAHDEPDAYEDYANQLMHVEASNTWSLGTGLGYNFTNHVRGDLTFDARQKTDITGERLQTGLTPRARSFSMSSAVLMANVYYDFGYRSHFSPYIGVGLGAVRHTIWRGSATDATDAVGAVHGRGVWAPAAALTAGASFNVANVWGISRLPDLYLDVGYRFLYMGEAKSGQVTTQSGVQTARGIKIDDMTAHELRVGVRYELR